MKHLKLRWLILALMLSNALVYGWREGLFEAWLAYGSERGATWFGLHSVCIKLKD